MTSQKACSFPQELIEPMTVWKYNLCNMSKLMPLTNCNFFLISIRERRQKAPQPAQVFTKLPTILLRNLLQLFILTSLQKQAGSQRKTRKDNQPTSRISLKNRNYGTLKLHRLPKLLVSTIGATFFVSEGITSLNKQEPHIMY